ncbi:MAG: serine protease [Actinomycetota bacterium]
MRQRRAYLVLLTISLMAIPVPSIAQSATPAWAPAAGASVKPGHTVITGPNLCTSNFVYFDPAGRVFLGQAAHCASHGDASQTNGCATPVMPLGTPVTIQGAGRPGTMAYNSWATMQAKNETDPNICRHNDFALIQVHPDDVGSVNPTIPHWGGPTGLATTTSSGDTIMAFVNSPMRLGINELKPLLGLSRGQSGDGWLHTIYSILPGLPGDSGGGIVDAQGKAFGVMSTLNLLPRPLSNGVGDLSKMLDYARQFGGMTGIQLAPGTEPFTGGSAPGDDLVQGLDGPLNLVESVLGLLGLF